MKLSEAILRGLKENPHVRPIRGQEILENVSTLEIEGACSIGFGRLGGWNYTPTFMLFICELCDFATYRLTIFTAHLNDEHDLHPEVVAKTLAQLGE
jgi:hypothetical protein